MLELFEIYKEFYLFDIQNNFIFLALYIAILFDIFLGHLKAWANKDFESKKSRQGIVTHGCLLLVLNLVYPIMSHLEICNIINSIMVLLTFSYLSSIIGNYKALGGYIPKSLEDYVENKYKDK